MTELRDDDVVIVAYSRTPIGRAKKGSLVAVRPEDLAATAVRAALSQVSGMDATHLDDLVVGCAEPHDEQNGNIARRVAVLLGYDDLPGTTVNRFCASSIQAARIAFHSIRAGEADAVLVGGVESISRTSAQDPLAHPDFHSAAARVRTQIESGAAWHDPRARGELPDYYIGMGWTAEFVSRITGTTRADQDDWALLSQTRAAAAQESGYLAGEIAPVTLPDGRVLHADESVRGGTSADDLAALRPVFSETGTVTAGNACPLNDGASALILASARFARAHALTPLARIRSTAVTALSPEIMGLGPVDSSRLVLQRAGLEIGDIDIVEMNEAFAAQVVPSARALNIDHERLNPFGGAIALGHPFGATGARLLGTLARGLAARNGQFGLATLCVGGGQGMAVVLERI